jgi:hypothetical protein
MQDFARRCGPAGLAIAALMALAIASPPAPVLAAPVSVEAAPPPTGSTGFGPIGLGPTKAVSTTPMPTTPMPIMPTGPATTTSSATRDAVLADWTQPTAASFHEWDAARRDTSRWAAYGFDWTTDYCTDGPERPTGFDFRLSCRRHDFGYRNYAAAGGLTAVRARLDRMLCADLKRTCGTYRAAVRPVCLGLAWVYYHAARRYGLRHPVGQGSPTSAGGRGFGGFVGVGRPTVAG